MHEEVIKLLHDLGEDGDAIAATLIEGGFKGHRGNADKCPIALFLSHHFKTPIVVFNDRVMFAHCLEECPLPSVIKDFIVDFDLGYYSTLITG